MTKFKSGDTTQLHYALTEAECNACGRHLEWQPNFRDISRPHYMSYHCDYQYIIYIDNVKVDIKKTEGEQGCLDARSKDEPRAILMAQTKKKEQQED
jgi:hypothetical protein